MFHLIITVSLAIMLSSCGNDQHERRANELVKLKRMVSSVGDDLNELGFDIDLNEIEIEVHNEREMTLMYNQISDESKQEVKAYTPFGPKALFNDGATSRLAFYDPNSKTIVFRAGVSKDITQGYLAHELAHVYQDQKWGFDQIWDQYHDSPSRERFSITQYMIEGHAELVRQAYEQRHAEDSLTVSAISANLGKVVENDCATCGRVTISDLPYSLGMRFLLHQYRSGGWPSVENVFLDPPDSTEQIIHPNKHGRDEPTILTLPKWEDQSKASELVLNGALGEAFLLSKLLSLKIPGENAFESASGWDGDVAHLYKLEDGSEVLVWRIVFDRIIDAQQMESAILNFTNPGDVFRLGRVLDWIISDDHQLKKQIRIFLSKHPFTDKTDLVDEESTREQEISIKNDARLFNTPYFQPKIVIGSKPQ